MSLPQSPTLSPSSPQPRTHIPPPWYTYHAPTASSGPFITLPSLSSPSSTSPPIPLFLTPLHPTDAPHTQRILSSPLVSSRLLRLPFPYTLADAESWIGLHQTTSAPCLSLQAIRLHHPTSDGQIIGAASLAKQDEPATYELGYYLDPEWHGRGIMRNAVLAVLSWAGREEGAEAVVVRVESSNEGSRRVVESIPGFVREEDEDVDWKGTPKILRVWRLRFER